MLTRLVALFVCFLAALRAGPSENSTKRLERDLGLGLTYYRIHDLPADLPSSSGSPLRAGVVDVRYVQADAAATTAFLAWVNFRASPRAPIFILANGDTARPLLAALHGHSPGNGVVVIGIVARSFQPDLVVRASAEDERRAYDAFESGTPVQTLLVENPDKIRHDEATLGKERRGEEVPDLLVDGPAKEHPPVLHDAVLQRAVQVHHALKALKKI